MIAATGEAASPRASEFTCNLHQPDAGEWRALRRRMSPEAAFFGGGWIEAWAESYLPHGRWRGPCRYLSVRNVRGELTGVFPFARMKFGPVEFRVGGGHFLPYRSVALAAVTDSRRDTCAAMAEALIDYAPWRLGLRIGAISDHDESSRAIATALAARGWHVGMRKLGQCFVLRAPANAARFNEVSGGMIKRANYYERRMRRAGSVAITEFRSIDSNRWRAALEDAAAIESNSWLSGEDGHLLFATQADKNFWAHAVCDDFLHEAITLWIMYFDGRPASFSLTLDAGGTKFILANLYDERLKDHRTGNILAYYIISRAIEQGYKMIDWGLGDSGYKRLWGAEPGHTLYDLLALPPGPISGIIKWAIERRSPYRF
jgi:CelD/BcsL family acetyltransferase involved in cellulose biosynthesis